MTEILKTKLFPQFFPTFWKDEFGIYSIPFVDEISIGFVEREEGGYSYLLQSDYLKIGISTKELLNSSITNLEKEFEDCDIKEYNLNGGSMAFWSSDNDNFTAVRILSPKYYSVLKSIFKGDFYFSIPNRDLITCWLTSDKNEMNKFINESIEDFETSEYRLSKNYYKFKDIKIY